MFEKATRMKLRFPCKGNISAEDLWDLPLEELDKLYSQLVAKQESSQKTSLLKKKTTADEKLDLQISIVKYIVEIRLKEQEDRELAATKRAEKQKLLGLIAKKKEADLEGKSIEELEKMVENL